MMNWYPKMYTGKRLEGETEKLIREIEDGQYRPDLFLITLAVNEKDLLDIRRARSLYREGLKDYLPLIVGIAKGRREALKIVEEIIADCLRETGDVNVRSFLC